MEYQDEKSVTVTEAPMPPAPAGVGQLMVQTREMTEIQAMVVSAKRFPRDLAQVRADILASCDSPALAEISQYVYQKGGTEITGPSIRLAEELAAAFQNVDKGWVELERKRSQGNVPGESVIQCFAWDMQRNNKAKRQFTVRHWRDTKKGGYALTDEREIYELCANQAARRLRACILEVIPKFIQEEAIVRCEETMKKTVSLDKQIPVMLAAFAKLNITKEMLEKRVQRKIETIDHTQFSSLRKVYQSLVDGMSTVAQWFESDAAVMTQNTAAAETATPATQSVTKEGRAKKAPAAKENSVGPQGPEMNREAAKEKPPVKNFATPDGIDELKKQREAKEEAARADKAKADAAEFAITEDPPKNEGPTFKEIYGECVGACKAMGWSPIRLAEFAKEKFKKSLKQMQDEDDRKSLMQIYETLLNYMDNPPPKGAQ